MESDYDRKFEEMKAYIPFLERMITRLDIGNSPTNPRQAQLDKIRSLRDLLLNKKKRMKMENLLKCEQVLITLHAKVEQRDGVADRNTSEKKTDSSELNVVRNKLKSVVSRLTSEVDRDGDVTEVEFGKIKEPALFQRRSNQKTLSPIKDDTSISPQSSKRNYTRVLHSPEKTHWPESSKTDIPLFSRRSPRKLLHRYSPSYKKEKKKSKKSKHTKLKDLNITLNVPEEKLNSLDTEDILPRIINCSDNDVDITTLRELRSQILGELKQTGVKDDISELLLKSCKTNTKTKVPVSTEIEEGELSDSESEAIENIYGSLIITNKDSSPSVLSTEENDKSRKIQICLVINSDNNEKEISNQEITQNKIATIVDTSDFQSFSESNPNSKVVNSLEIDERQKHGVLDSTSKTLDSGLFKEKHEEDAQECDEISQKSMDKDQKLEESHTAIESIELNTLSLERTQSTETKIVNKDKAIDKGENAHSRNDALPDTQDIAEENETKSFIPNFYKSNQGNEASDPKSVAKPSASSQEVSDLQTSHSCKEEETKNLVDIKSSVEIPLLDLEATTKQDIVSEIDILQALKKEILGETTTPSVDTNTPALHQPKITKVAKAQEIVKKRISIENYKQKCNEPTKPLFLRDISKKSTKEDQHRKQSLKLTEKEFERFKLPIKLPLHDSSDEDENLESIDDYSDLAPKSPDHEDFADIGIKPPVIIPSDPVKPIVHDSFLDVDMRNDDFPHNVKEHSIDFNKAIEKKLKESDPRRTKTRWENEEKVALTGIALDSTATQQSSMVTSRNTSGPNMTPSRLSVVSVQTPSTSVGSNISSKFVPMTPNARTYEMTPSRLDSEDMPSRGHVYAPMFLSNTGDRNEDNRIKDSNSYVWETNTMPRNMGRFGRIECSTPTPLPSYGKVECPTTPLPSFGRHERAMTPVNSYNIEGSATPVHSYGRTEETVRPPYPYNRSERIITAGHSYSQFDGSATPIHSYGRVDAPATPSHPFGRPAGLDTPSHCIGRLDSPAHSYGVQDGAGTPAASFGGRDGYSFNYLEGSTTPSRSFGRTDYMRNYQPTKPMYGRNDPRLHRSCDFENYTKREDNREYGYYKERKCNPDYSSDRRGPDDFRRYKQNFGRNEINRSFDRKNDRYCKDFVPGKDQFDRSMFNNKETLSRRNKTEYKYYNECYKSQREQSVERNYRAPCNSYENDSDAKCRSLDIDTSASIPFNNLEQPKKSFKSCDHRRQRAASVSRVNNFDRSSPRAPSVSRINFDSRRQRASSVGRVLASSTDRITYDNKRATSKSDVVNKRKDFHRASSVGKELNVQRYESLKNIKDDLRSFKIKNDLNIEKRFGDKSYITTKTSENKIDISVDKSKIDSNPNKKTHSTERYSPRKNYRDPRLRRESKLQHKEKYKNKSQFRYSKKPGIVYSDVNISKGTILGPGCSVKNYKIPKIKRPPEIENEDVPDNSKDTVSEEPLDDTTKERKSDSKSESIDSDSKNVNTNEVDNINNASNGKNVKVYQADRDTNNMDNVLKGNSDRRITRSSVLSTPSNDNLNEEIIVKRTKKCKTKPIIYESESDSDEKALKTVRIDQPPLNSDLLDKEVNLPSNAQLVTQCEELTMGDRDIENSNNKQASNDSSEHNPNNTSTRDNTLPPVELNISSIVTDSTDKMQQIFPEVTIHNNINDTVNKENEILSKEPLINNTGNESINSSFGELEIFSDTIASDPVLDNINELIADLDHDLNTVKSNEVRGSFKQDFVLDQMFDSIKEDRYMVSEQASVENIMDSKRKEVSQDEHSEDTNKILSKEININEEVDNKSTKSDCLSDKSPFLSNLEMEPSHAMPKNVDVDSSDAIVTTTKDDKKFLTDEQNTVADGNVISNHKPDSTINVIGEIVPDSTNEPNECNDLISSSNSEIQNSTITVDSSQSADKTDTIGNFLSILNDKSKIRELLSLLGEHSSKNEKIKKKLEKLSAIVSDDEDDIMDDKSDATESKMCYLDNTIEVRQSNTNKDYIESTKCPNELDLTNTLDGTERLNVLEENKSNIHSSVEVSQMNDGTEAPNATDKEAITNIENNILPPAESKPDYVKETKVTKKGRGKKFKKSEGTAVKKRLTRSGAVEKNKKNKPSRELLNLQADIREMFLKDDEDILGGTTGLRMCRLAKLVDRKSHTEESPKTDTMAIVRMEKTKNTEDSIMVEKTKRKYTRKIKTDRENKTDEESPTSVTKETPQRDPYLFETDSLKEFASREQTREDFAENDSDSAESSRSESSEQRGSGLKKKPKRKRSAWQSGIIVPKHKKRKSILTKPKIIVADIHTSAIDGELKSKISNMNFYIDKTYCFSKGISEYDCKLCNKKFKNIVYHYRREHPHSEIPLSRMSADVAHEAIKQCEIIDFRAVCQIPTYRYVCRFCFKEFIKCKTLESFFWHIVSVHTGEYREPCTVCDDDTKCTFALDIPPPPLKQKGQLIGYICGNCNYTQISLENLKTHVINRHNDEQTEVYTINMSHMSVKALNSLLKQTKKLTTSNETEEQRVLRSSRTCVSSEITDEKNIGDESDSASTSGVSQQSDLRTTKKNTKIQSKITFENDSDNEKNLHISKMDEISLKIKEEPKDVIDDVRESGNGSEQLIGTSTITPFDESTVSITDESKIKLGKDINESPHFKVTYTETGSKQYVCCINDYPHYKTSLMISFKKHIQVAHVEKWDGYCCICRVIVMPQGLHSYRNCLDHFIDKHLDNFPVLESSTEKLPASTTKKPTDESVNKSVVPVNNSPKPFLSVRPLSELLKISSSSENRASSPLPIIESVVSLGSSIEPSISYPAQGPIQDELKRYLYEEAQAEIMSRKNRIILDAMLSHDKLAQVFKCSGRFCSYTTNSAEDALLHVSTHSRIGGDNALKCVYCDFDCLDNAIDLVTHVFKYHGFCQYVCGHCFYRATAGQLVNAHIARVHENEPVKAVLKSSFTTEPIETDMLSREAAVSPYVCTCDDEGGAKCKFKTYTPGKLCEHIKGKHKDVTVHECFICKATTDSIAELVHHYKSHGLKLYQCVWCVFGADSESELLMHSSIHHAVCQPKAYLRVITNKEGTSEFRVLPLAHLNKSNTPNITEVPPTGVRENPVREAERSIDLEKLIGQTTSFNESTAIGQEETPNEILPDESSIADSMLNFTPEQQSRPCTPPAAVATDQQLTPTIKSEVITPTTIKPGMCTDVICLDSDEEDLNASNVSRDSNLSSTTSVLEPAPSVDKPERKQFPLKSLYKCAKCSILSKNSPQFRSHLSECFSNQIHIPCAYCSYKGAKTRIVPHYTKNHLDKSKPMERKESSESSGSVEHQSVENPSNIVISAKKVGGVTVRELSAKKNSKRKISAETSGEPPVKVPKYGPHEIHQLPINPIFEHFIYCSLCEFNTKVRLNMVRHLQLHASQQPVPQTAPVNPVPHLETNEMHFDRMLNLASSSLANRHERNSRSETPAIPIPMERASWYPKYVPERTRHTCGAKGCSYISVDENMLKCHWETLHSGSNDFHCVHCPSNQRLHTKTPVTASRIIAHIKMHDTKLYACSQCTFYHFKRTVVEKHVNEVHKRGSVMVVREEVTVVPQTAPTVSASTAPTMDLKPWQCGLCEYKSLLRPEVVQHCAKTHNSKMQFKCVYCAFRTSNEENVTKHQSQSHQGQPAVTFYFYYREGSMPNEDDGTPFWKIQTQAYGPHDTKIKSEKGELPSSTTADNKTTPPIVNLSLVKQEVEESSEESIDDLCKLFGQFCEPNGLRYKCPLCKIVIEDTKEAMQSHLFEELKYRKWSCSVCFYKAFHKRGLSEHMTSEHCINRDPVELPVDNRVETWVAGLLQHQEVLIDNCRKKLAKQKAEILKKPQGVNELKSLLITQTPMSKEPDKPSKEELESKFGVLGSSKGMSFCCPKCNEVFKEECTMRNHLETELNKIRWCCSTCPETFTSYHQAQFHCKTHSGQSSRPVEAPRDLALRTAWVDAVIEVQKLSMDCAPQSDTQERQLNSPEPSENSLLVVRYEERVPTPEVQSALVVSPSSDDDRLVINEIRKRKRKGNTSCEYCKFSCPKKKALNEHILQIHYNLKPFMCEYCKITGSISHLKKHQKIYHALKPINIKPTQVPNETPDEWSKKKLDVPCTGLICLICQLPVLQSEIQDHVHENAEPEFGRIGEVIVKCSTCSTFHKDIQKFEEHKMKQHSSDSNYVFYKLTNRPVQFKCSYCPQKFTLKKDLKAHKEASHAEALKYTTLEPQSSKDGDENVIILDDEEETMAEVSVTPAKKVARKSTSKLPFLKTVARKSTSKLPMENQGYSFYGTKPCLDGLENVTTMMPFYNSYMPITFGRLSGVLNINPKVVITKLPKVIMK